SAAPARRPALAQTELRLGCRLLSVGARRHVAHFPSRLGDPPFAAARRGTSARLAGLGRTPRAALRPAVASRTHPSRRRPESASLPLARWRPGWPHLRRPHGAST